MGLFNSLKTIANIAKNLGSALGTTAAAISRQTITNIRTEYTARRVAPAKPAVTASKAKAPKPPTSHVQTPPTPDRIDFSNLGGVSYSAGDRTSDDIAKLKAENQQLRDWIAKKKEAEQAEKDRIYKNKYEKYGITESDFLSAELCLVPSFKAKDIGFDRSMIGAYGHDDRVCAYPALTALVEAEASARTCISVLADKEETGSDGNTGLASDFLRFVVRDLAEKQGVDYTVALRHSKCLSADVNAGMDPTFKDVMEARNASKLNYGAVITKYTGARGKAGTSDASAEYVAYVRNMLDNAGITWQTGELGKVDLGGGGTVAMYVANMGVDVVDLGVPVLSMHAPFEVVSKFDVFETYRTMYEFCK